MTIHMAEERHGYAGGAVYRLIVPLLKIPGSGQEQKAPVYLSDSPGEGI